MTPDGHKEFKLVPKYLGLHYWQIKHKKWGKWKWTLKFQTVTKCHYHNLKKEYHWRPHNHNKSDPRYSKFVKRSHMQRHGFFQIKMDWMWCEILKICEKYTFKTFHRSYECHANWLLVVIIPTLNQLYSYS